MRASQRQPAARRGSGEGSVDLEDKNMLHPEVAQRRQAVHGAGGEDKMDCDEEDTALSEAFKCQQGVRRSSAEGQMDNEEDTRSTGISARNKSLGPSLDEKKAPTFTVPLATLLRTTSLTSFKLHLAPLLD